MKNEGKKFEDDFKKSCPEYCLLYRLPDSAQSFGNSRSLRFSRKNPFDFLLWDSTNHTLFALELKTVLGKSISFERVKEDSGDIHFHQLEGLRIWDAYDGIVCGFVIFFRDIETTVFIEISEFDKLIGILKKKSFNFDDLSNFNIQYNIIKQVKVRTRYVYDINDFLTHR